MNRVSVRSGRSATLFSGQLRVRKVPSLDHTESHIGIEIRRKETQMYKATTECQML